MLFRSLPEGFTVPDGRSKPWGTGQALLAARGLVDNPFVVINADDYYGKEAYGKLHEYLTSGRETPPGIYDICMAGFILKNTLSENGGVTRGICEVNGGGILQKVTETYDIQFANGVLSAREEDGTENILNATQHVSMNMWGLRPEFLDGLEGGFTRFLSGLKPGDVKSEYLLPRIIDNLIQEGRARVKVLETKDRWFGVTYREDRQSVTDAIRELTERGIYKEKLF